MCICIIFQCRFLSLPAPLPRVSNFRVIEEGLFSLRLGWTPPLGKLNGFKIFIPRCMLTFYNATLLYHCNKVYSYSYHLKVFLYKKNI